MSSHIVSQIVVWVVLICAPLSAWAGGQWSQRCEAAGNESAAACRTAAGAATRADNMQAYDNIAGVGSSSTVNPAAGASQQQANDQVNRLNTAKGKCEAEKAKCEKKCDEEEAKRKAAETPPTTRQQAQADSGKVEQKKQSACVAPLVAMLGELGTGASNAAKAAADAGKTGGASNGGMPLPLPIPIPGGGDKKEDGAKGENPVAEKLNCENEGYSKYSDCNNHYIDKCQKGMTSAGCDGFIARYCGSTQTPAPTPLPGNDSLKISVQSAKNAAVTANLVADKQGEGLGSKFCQHVTAYKYCQMAGRSECPSCKNLNSPWPATSNPGQMADAQKSCPTDPMFLDPAVQAQLKKPADAPASPDASQVSTSLINDRFSATAPSAGSAGGGGGGNLGGAGGAGSVGAEPTPGVGDRYQAQSSDSFAGGSGGGGDGGGSSYEGSASGPGYSPASVVGDAKRAPTMVGQAGPKDVANQYGPSVFSIQSTTYRDMCARGRLLHCRR